MMEKNCQNQNTMQTHSKYKRSCCHTTHNNRRSGAFLKVVCQFGGLRNRSPPVGSRGEALAEVWGQRPQKLKHYCNWSIKFWS